MSASATNHRTCLTEPPFDGDLLLFDSETTPIDVRVYLDFMGIPLDTPLLVIESESMVGAGYLARVMNFAGKTKLVKRVYCQEARISSCNRT